MPSIIYFSILISCSAASTLRSSATYCSMVTNFWRGPWNSGWTCGLKPEHYGQVHYVGVVSCLLTLVNVFYSGCAVHFGLIMSYTDLVD